MIDQSSDSRKATEITSHNTIILVTFVFYACSFVGSPIFEIYSFFLS